LKLKKIAEISKTIIFCKNLSIFFVEKVKRIILVKFRKIINFCKNLKKSLTYWKIIIFCWNLKNHQFLQKVINFRQGLKNHHFLPKLEKIIIFCWNLKNHQFLKKKIHMVTHPSTDEYCLTFEISKNDWKKERKKKI